MKGAKIVVVVRAVRADTRSNSNAGSSEDTKTVELDESKTVEVGTDGSIEGYYHEDEAWVKMEMEMDADSE